MHDAQLAAIAAPIDSVALSLGPLSIQWYGLILGLGILAALTWAITEGKKHNIPQDLFIDLVLFGVPAGIIGARIYYVAFRWDYYNQNPGEIFAIWQGGLAIHGVLISSVIVALVFARLRGLSFWKLMDILAPGILLAQGIGRWGNFINQEAHGGVLTREYLEGLRLPEFIINQMYIYNPNPGAGLEAGFHYHHPTFLYESIWNFTGVILLVLLSRVNWGRFSVRQGEILFGYFIWYSIGRFFIEGMRTDSLMLTDTLRIAQVMSILLIIGSIAAITYRRKTRALPDYWEPAQLIERKQDEAQQAAKKKKKTKKKK